jgi:uncharacterized protein with HEPN domain
MEKADVIRLQHMRDATAEALHFAAGKTRADLDRDRMMVLAILKDLEIIGEAASRVSPAAKESSSTVPWDEILRMRNRLIHGYFDVNLDVVWGTLVNDLPQLLNDIDKILLPPQQTQQ